MIMRFHYIKVISIYLTITGVTKIVRFTGDFVIIYIEVRHIKVPLLLVKSPLAIKHIYIFNLFDA